MKKEFVPYELALRMKALNFDEPCLAGYSTSSGNLEHYSRPLVTKDSFTVDAPTFSQAFKWFRENHGLCIVIKPIDDKKLELGYNLTKNGLIMSAHLTYESAELFSLKKLIEIVEQNKSE